MAKNPKLESAVETAEVLGWPMLPCWWIEDGKCGCGDPDCGSPGKHPIGKLVPHGLKDATADLDTIHSWWKAFPRANPATRTGDRCWVLDLDGLAGIQSFARVTNNRDLPETPTSRTGGGGRHIFLAANPTIRNAAKLGGESVDVRGVGGYVLIPPSDHLSGNAYLWELPPSKYDLATAPEWLVKYAINGHTNGKATGKADGLKFRFEDTGDLVTHPGVGKGSRNDALCRIVGSHLKERGLTEDLLPAAIAWGQRCRPPLSESQVHKTATALAAKHVAGKAEQSRGIVVTGYNDIEPEEITWLWNDRFALGKLSLLSGDPGLGKTFVALDVSARVSAGRPFPDGTPCEQGDVLYCTCEDGAADTIRPRLDAMEADVRHVWHFEGVKGTDGKVAPFRVDTDLPPLVEYLERMPGLRLLVLDPISGHLGAVDSHVNAEVRAVLGPLAKVAERFGVTILGINHFTKAQGKAIHRNIGSIGFVATARTAWAVVADPDDSDRRLFLPVKQNLAKATGLAYRILDGRVEWESKPIIVAMDDLDDDSLTPRDEARAWLQSTLGKGPVSAQQILKRAKTDGIAERTLYRAKKELRVESKQFQDGWAWALPSGTDTTKTGGDPYVF